MKKNGRITAYIHMDAIARNFQNMRANIKEDTQVIAVIKTDGYGHGAVPVARMAEQYDYIWGFAVATADEAQELRDAGIRKPVLVLGYTFEEDYEGMVRLGIRPAVFTMEAAASLDREAERQGVCAPVHLAVDTGMSRIGVPDDASGLATAEQIAALAHLKIEGVFTHFARADEADKTNAGGQISRFTAFCDALDAAEITGFLRHCSNSAGILELPQANMDLVRAGITIYGIYPSDEVSRVPVTLFPAMELKSHVVHVKTVPAGTPVSYGGTFVTQHETQIATIPVGYGDGYPRGLSGKGSVLIHGKRAPVLGRVCMDQFMVDVTGMDVRVLDEVTLLGRDGDEEITADELGALSGRFPYELVCCVGRRVPRVYIP